MTAVWFRLDRWVSTITSGRSVEIFRSGCRLTLGAQWCGKTPLKRRWKHGCRRWLSFPAITVFRSVIFAHYYKKFYVNVWIMKSYRDFLLFLCWTFFDIDSDIFIYRTQANISKQALFAMTFLWGSVIHEKYPIWNKWDEVKSFESHFS